MNTNELKGEKSPAFKEGNLFLYKRFRQIVSATQIAFILGALNATFNGGEVFADNFIGLRLDIAAMLAAALMILVVFVFLKWGKYELAGAIYLWVCTITMFYVAWFEGGLYSLATLSFPLIFIFAALFTQIKVFISIFVFTSLIFVFYGMNHIYGFYPAPEKMMVHGVPRILGGLVITTISGYVAWIIGKDMKGSMADLQYENRRVVESQKLITQMAETDSLTGLLNRSAAQEAYTQMLSGLVKNTECIAFYFIDLDNFKNINDLFDHHAGDQLLITIASRLKDWVGSNDVACRLGGDEFVVFVKANEQFDFDGFAKKLIHSVAQPHFIIGAEAEVTASIGIAVVKHTQTSFDEVRKKADMAMYKAKQSGKNKYHYYSDDLNKEYMRNLNIINGLKDALNHNLLDLYFQPKIDLSSNETDGAEALLRWNRGNPQNIDPDEFIPIIESTELIHDIGAWVIQEACETCKAWHEAGHFISIAVNVSALQLTRANFLNIVVQALRVADLKPHYLELELTEHLLIQENKLVKNQLGELKRLGISLSIDDFGTGYSNMSYLTRLKVDTLKLDKSFISQISLSEDYLVIVTAIIQMAKVLGMKVIAEGIELDIERKLLIGLGCDYAQGFLWSEAITGNEFMLLLDESPVLAEKKTATTR